MKDRVTILNIQTQSNCFLSTVNYFSFLNFNKVISVDFLETILIKLFTDIKHMKGGIFVLSHIRSMMHKSQEA